MSYDDDDGLVSLFSVRGILSLIPGALWGSKRNNARGTFLGANIGVLGGDTDASLLLVTTSGTFWGSDVSSLSPSLECSGSSAGGWGIGEDGGAVVLEVGVWLMPGILF